MPIYLLWGDENYKLDLKLKELKKTILKNNITPLNYKKYDNPDFKTLDEALRSTGSMFGSILSILRAEKFFMSKKDGAGIKDNEIEEIEKSLKVMTENNHVVFLLRTKSGEKPDMRKKLYKLCAKYGAVEAFEGFKSYETYKVVPEILKMARDKKLELNQNLATKIVEMSGVSLLELSNQLDKLALLSANGKITEKMIDEVCTETEDIFLLSDFILSNNFHGFVKEVGKLLLTKHPLEIWGLLQTTFSNLFKIKIYNENYNTMEISRLTGQHEFIVKKNLQKIKNVSAERIAKIKKALIELEFDLKTGKIQDEFLVFEKLFSKIGDSL